MDTNQTPSSRDRGMCMTGSAMEGKMKEDTARRALQLYTTCVSKAITRNALKPWELVL